MRSAADSDQERGSSALAPGFVVFRVGRTRLYLNHALAFHAPSILTQLRSPELIERPGIGNRGSGFAFELSDGLELFVRLARRGGLLRRLNPSLYLGFRPRPLIELATAVRALDLGVPVAQPLGAWINWIAPGIYRGALLTRRIRGMTLWEFLRTDDDPHVRNLVIEEARRAIETMHQAGVFHADLNLHNLFVARAGETFSIVILDLDKARIYARPLHLKLRRFNLERLARSARKLDRTGAIFDPTTLAILTGPGQ
jgi:3-deoxy-D-manno-octulosonic acid kinase